MSSALQERIYAASPALLQSALLSLEGWRVRRERLGGDFGERLAAYRRAERAGEDEVREIRARRLRRLLSHAGREIPYWRDLFRERGIEPERVSGPEDLRALPVLTKSEVLARGPALVWAGAPRDRVRHAHTSGTTGAGLVFATSLEAVRDQWAVWWRYRIRHGLTPGTWMAMFGGRTVVPGEPRGTYWRVNRAMRQVHYSQYHLRPDTAAAYLEDIARRGLPWLHGYPSLLSLLAGWAADRRWAHRPRAVTLGAENLLAAQRRAIREGFGVEPIQNYGQAEGVANASQCPAGRLHLDEDYAAVELVPEGEGTVRIVGTNLENLVQPFIRYDTGDLARVAPGCACGLPGRVLEEVDGRQEDVLVLSDGSRVGRVDHLFKDMVRVAEAQVRQAVPGRCAIDVVPRPGWTAADAEALRAECRARFGDRLEVEIRTVEAIPRTARGKLRLVVREPAPPPPRASGSPPGSPAAPR